MADDPYDLDRFVRGQSQIYEVALAEITSGRKRSHWMWFIFPQFAGLGSSRLSVHYAIRSEPEARAYLAHPILGARLRQCAEALLAVNGRSASEIFGSPDDVKLRSSMTLFAVVSAPGSVFHRVLHRYFGGEGDERTLALLAGPWAR